MRRNASVWSGLGSAVVLSGALSGCGGSSQGAGGDSHPELVQTFEVAPGTCGVSRSITFLKGDFEVARIVRAPAGFVVSGTRTGTFEPGWLSLSLDGVSQRMSFSGWNQPAGVLADFPFAASLTELHPVLLTSVASLNGARLHAWPLDDPGSELDVGAYFARGTTRMAFASSRDGKQAVFAAEHPATFAPHLLPLDSRGGTGGGQLVLDEGIVVCLLAVPTADSFAVGVLYTMPEPLFRIVAPADGSGGASLALSTSGCPLLQSDRLLTVAAAVGEAVQFFVFASGEILPLITDPPLLADLGSVPRWLSRHTAGGFSLLVVKDGQQRLAEMSEAGTVTWLPGELPAGNVIPGDPGELFLDVFEPDQAGTFRHRIVQVTCNGVGFRTD